ncbi:MAG: response regulator [Gemmataceae bacterium]
MSEADTIETILLVDDEEPVRRTFREWLDSANLGCRILTAGDAAAALEMADRWQIDLAILDWNLGAGHDGLQLLEDLLLFNPDIVAILVTGFANQATPLMALRMGVRDYLDKNHDLDRATFLQAVTRQLERIRPLRRQKQLQQELASFRAAVERILPLVQTTSALHDPVPLPVAVRSLLTFLLEATGATDGVLVVHGYDATRPTPETYRAYDATGQPILPALVPFARSVAGGVVSLQEPHVLTALDSLVADGTVELQPFEQGRRTVLAAPIAVGPGLHVVLELFDPQAGGSFSAEARRLVRAAASFGGDLLRQALAEQQTHRVLFGAVEAALRAGDQVTQVLGQPTAPRPDDPPPPEIMEQLRQGLRGSATEELDAAALLRLAEAIRVLALRHGPRALEHCTRLVEDLRCLLDAVAGLEGESRA